MRKKNLRGAFSNYIFLYCDWTGGKFRISFTQPISTNRKGISNVNQRYFNYFHIGTVQCLLLWLISTSLSKVIFEMLQYIKFIIKGPDHWFIPTFLYLNHLNNLVISQILVDCLSGHQNHSELLRFSALLVWDREIISFYNIIVEGFI